MSIAAPVFETADPNSIATLPITLEELITGVIGQVGRAQTAADNASNLLEDTEQQAALAEASRVAALASQTAAAASASAAAATAAAIDGLFDDEEAAALDNIEDAKNAAILAVQAVSELRPAVFISVTGSMNLVAGWAYGLDAATGMPVELTLPANPSPGDTILIADRETIGFATTYVLKRNGKTILSKDEDCTIDTPGIAFHIWWNGADWRIF